MPEESKFPDVTSAARCLKGAVWITTSASPPEPGCRPAYEFRQNF